MRPRVFHTSICAASRVALSQPASQHVQMRAHSLMARVTATRTSLTLGLWSRPFSVPKPGHRSRPRGQSLIFLGEKTWGGGGRRRRSRGGGAQGSRREGRGQGRGGPRAGGQNASRRPGLVPSLQSRPEVSSNNTEPEASSVHTQCVESVTQRCGSEQVPGTVEQGRHPVGREENFHSVGAVSFCFPAP